MKWFEIPENLIPKLRELQKQNLSYPIVKSEDAVVMYIGMGGEMYLTFDGRVITVDWMDGYQPNEAKTLSEAAMALVLGAERSNLPELLSLLPSRPPEAEDCLNCKQTGWLNLGSETLTFICGDCGGLGWKVQETGDVTVFGQN